MTSVLARMAEVRPDLPLALPCPECRYVRQAGGQARIGNHRKFCATCNRFVATVRQRAAREMRETYPEEYARLRARIERDLYPDVVERWLAAHPEARTPQEMEEEWRG